MANQIPQLKADILTALQTRLDAPTRTDVSDVLVNFSFPNEWKAYLLTNNVTDTPTNRGLFLAEMIFNFINTHYRRGKELRDHAAIPPATGIN